MTKKFLLTLGAILFISSVSLFAQSKKELEAEVKKLQAETKKLQAEIEELKKPKAVDLNTANKKAGYSLGVLVASDIKGRGVDSLDVEAMTSAIKDVYEKKTLQID